MNIFVNRYGGLNMKDLALAATMEWTFTQETTPPKEIQDVLITGETVEAAYKTIRDVAVVTNKRLIIADKQGITGKKVEVYTIPFKSINMYSSENAGKVFDINAELELWTRAGKVKLKVNKGVDIRKLDRIIAEHIL
jgi:ribosomal protein L30E